MADAEGSRVLSVRTLLLLTTLVLVLVMTVPLLRGHWIETVPRVKAVRESFCIFDAPDDATSRRALRVLVQRARRLGLTNVRIELAGRAVAGRADDALLPCVSP